MKRDPLEIAMIVAMVFILAVSLYFGLHLGWSMGKDRKVSSDVET